jgi:hypothetical protein
MDPWNDLDLMNGKGFFKTLFKVWGVGVVLCLLYAGSLLAAVVYVLVHFLKKFW